MDKDRGKISPSTDISDVKIKQEPSDDIKNYAETTMNELLGWYGYDAVSSMETEHLNLTKYRSSSSKDRQNLERKDEDSDCDSDDSLDSPADDDSVRSSEQGETSLAAQHRNLVSALNKRRGTSSGSSDSPPSPEYIVCAWCQKPGLKLFTLKSSSGVKPFCSELCFTQCRRASFKKNKICDWCKHVRHTVNYVEFQDGDIQYQFCSEKCLSQYKMNIFCRETQEHLNKIKSSESSEENNNCDTKEKHILITPDLWLKERNESKPVKEMKDSSDEMDENTSKLPSSDRNDLSSTITSRSEATHRSLFRHSIPRHTGDSSRHHPDLVPRKSRNINSHTESKESNTKTSSPTKISQFSSKPPPMSGLPGAPFIPPWFPPQHLMSGIGQGMMNHPLLYDMMSPCGLPFHMSQERVDNRSENRAPVGQNSVSPTTSVGSMEGNPVSQQHNGGIPSAPRTVPPPLLPFGYPPFPYPQFNGENPFGNGVFPFPLQNSMFPNSMMGTGAPPVTVMVPFPVVLPVPVPIPLPLPITAEKLQEFFKEKANEEKQKQAEAAKSRPENLNRSKSAEPIRTSTKKEHTDDCLQCASCTTSSSRTTSRSSVDSVRNLKRDSIIGIYSHKVKRSLTPSITIGSNLSKKPKLELVKSDPDGAMDLSKDSMKVFVGKENRDVSTKGEDSKPTSDIRENEYMLKVPRIHIVNTDSAHDVAQALPPAPSDTNYSNRRSLILDAPNIPKREQSPSPERRYVRTVSRDMVEAARRRCLRARVKTK